MTNKESTVTTSLHDFGLSESRMVSQTSAAASYNLILVSCISSFLSVPDSSCVFWFRAALEQTKHRRTEKLIAHLLMWKCIISLSPRSVLNNQPNPSNSTILANPFSVLSSCHLSNTCWTWNSTLLKFPHKNYLLRFRKHRWGLASQDVNSGLLD